MVSIVIPIFNEQENLPELGRRLAAALEGEDWEVVFVDDGSRDESAKILAETFLFITNFAIQRDFIFARRIAGEPVALKKQKLEPSNDSIAPLPRLEPARKESK